MADAQQLPLHLHEESEVDALARLILSRDPQDQRIVILSGKPDSGRRSLLAAAVERARRDAEAGDAARGVWLAHTDLDGFEPDSVTPSAYLAYQLSKLGRVDDPAASELAARVEASPEAGVAGIALLAAVAGRDARSDELCAAAAASLQASGVDWGALISEAADRVVVLHLTDSAQIPATLRDELLGFAERNVGLLVALSSDPIHGSQKVTLGRHAALFEVMALEENELSRMLDERVEDRSAGQAAALIAASAGSRGLIRLRLAQGGSPPTPGEALADLARVAEDAERRKTLEAFLAHAALCGDCVPVRTLLQYLGVVGEQLDDWIDWIDENIGSDSEQRLFADRFQHPSFSGELVYGFREPAEAEAIRLALPPESRRRMARAFVEWLLRSVAIQTRAGMRLVVDLCFHAGADKERIEFERELSWWAGAADCDRLRRLLVRESRLKEQMWAAVNSMQLRWPPSRSLAIVDALVELGVPPDLMGPLSAIRGGLLLHLRRFEDAAREARNGIERGGPDRLLESVLIERLATAQEALGDTEEAVSNSKRSLEIRLELLASGDERVESLLRQQAAMLRQAGREAEAGEIEARLG